MPPGPRDDAPPESDDECRLLLGVAPGPPADVDLFSSNTLFGQPGIYPDGSTMIPASGEPMELERGRRLVDMWDSRVPGATATAVFLDGEVADRAPDPVVRCALAMLSGGPAAPILQSFLDGSCLVRTVGIGATPPGRVIGTGTASEHAATGPHHLVLNERYRAEHPAAVAPSLAHALCHHGDRASNAEEATLHGLLAAVHTWFLANDASLATSGTELARRQASLTITLLNARAPGDWRASIRCPEGPGTIPGGNPALQTPDLWSIPFTSRPAGDCELTIPEAVRRSLARLAASDAAEPPGSYDGELGQWLTGHLGDGPWFGPCQRVRAGRALGLLATA